MREKFSEKVYLDCLFKTTSTQNQYSANEFRESAHVTKLVGVAVSLSRSKHVSVVEGTSSPATRTFWQRWCLPCHCTHTRDFAWVHYSDVTGLDSVLLSFLI